MSSAHLTDSGRQSGSSLLLRELIIVSIQTRKPLCQLNQTVAVAQVSRPFGP